MRYEPASTIIDKLGGVSAVAREVQCAPQTVIRWRRPKTVGGTGGTIPQRHHITLLAAAKERGIRLRAEDFLPQEEKSGCAA